MLHSLSIHSYSSLPNEAKQIRISVFVNEQGFKEEFDTIDNICTHYVLYFDEKPVATARLFYNEEHECYCVGRFAILKGYRRLGLGKKLMEYIEQKAKTINNASLIGVSAQQRAIPFYKACGYKETDSHYLDEGYPHVWMIKKLN